MTEPIAVTARIGQRGRLILPVQVQRAAHITEGDPVVLRTTTTGAITLEPLWAVRQGLRHTFAPLLADHLPAEPALMLAGGHPLPDDTPPHPLPDALRHLPAGVPTGEKRVVVTASAVLAWIKSGPDSRVNMWLDRAVLPEAAAGELVTVLARAGAHERADHLLAELALLGVRRPSTAEHRTALAADTAHALDLTARAAVAGLDLPMPDALCAAAAHRLDAPLLAAGLLPTETP
ncbi:AbrB/MazE/SpoVT family DNA-binding domain-containing protein (plasmid) [Kitasatospora purpeofusca]|uniref:AbrB/MazE/SpoVT family DNA-binding domain-containing protein n=1 Tax=Kitasatospora purpeofusca TaxID=67352 RepID=UPI002E15BC8A|nr:AbrB/MazE/SpoVT family DNA-binding domain-containing protein [Kitasatospora purpeofusca]